MKRGVIDIGNSRIKTAVFSPLGEPTEKATMNSLQEAINWQQMQGSESVILASVKQETAIPGNAICPAHTQQQQSIAFYQCI